MSRTFLRWMQSFLFAPGLRARWVALAVFSTTFHAGFHAAFSTVAFSASSEAWIQSLSEPQCVSDSILGLPELQNKWIRNDSEIQSSIALKRILAGANITETVHTIPVVFHVIHLGEPVGVGSNISDEQIQSAVTALNHHYRKVPGTTGDGAGVDTKIQFALAKRAPGNIPHTGINRIDGRGVSLYSTKGVNSPGVTGAASEADIKSLSTWPRSSYLNIWVVTEIDDNGGVAGTQGYAYQPLNSVLDGVTIVHSAVGTIGSVKSSTNHGKILTHEVGHFLGLFHTYHQTSTCSSETSCSTQGDLVCDTPTTIYASSCAFPACSGTQQVQNYMDATSQSCQNRFTQGQKDRMRSTLENSRVTLLSSNGATPVNTYDLALTSAVLPPFVCGSGGQPAFQPTVRFSNLGSATVTSAQVRYRINGGSWESVTFSGSLPTGSDHTSTLPGLPTLMSGNYSVEFNVTNPNGQADQYSGNDSTTLSTVAPALGETINVQFNLDLNGKDNTYTISNAGSTYYYGGPFSNNQQGTVLNHYHCLPQGCHTVSVFDLFGDGQSFSSGSYQVLSESLSVLASGSGNWGSHQTHTVCVAGATAPTPTPTPTATPTPYVDPVPPTVSWVQPVSGTLVNLESGTRLILNAEASDNVEVDRVEFYDGANLIGTVPAGPYTLAWNITSVPDGEHDLKAVAYDIFGNEAETAPVMILIDRVPPTGAIVSPVHLANISTPSLTIEATANDQAGIDQVEFYLDFNPTPIAIVTAAPYQATLDPTALPYGAHVVGIKVVDVAHNAYTPSTVNFIRPRAGSIPGIEVTGVFGGSALGCFSRAQQEVYMSINGCMFGCSSSYDVNGDGLLNVLDLVRVMGGVCHE